MSAYASALSAVPTYVRNYVANIAHPIPSSSTITNVGAAPCHNTLTHEFHDSIPAFQHNYGNLPVRRMVSAVSNVISLADMTWFFALIFAALYYSPRHLISVLSDAWQELEGDVETFMQRHFPAQAPGVEQQSTTAVEEEKEVVPPGAIVISAQELTELNASADKIQQRINRMRMPKVNFVRSRRTNIVFQVGACIKMHNQLAEVRKALVEEFSGHQDTKDFLEHQTNGRADAEELRAKLEEVEPQIERLEKRLEIEQANYRSVFTKKEVFRHGGKKLKEELEALQAEYNVLEDGRDTWKETCGAMAEQTKALRDRINSDNAHNQRRIGALETRLEVERTAREETQGVERDLREQNEKLQHELEEARNFGGESRYLGEKLKAEYNRVKAELDELDAHWDAELKAESDKVAHTLSARRHSQPRNLVATNAQDRFPTRRVKSAPLWLPLPHHGDTFDPLYNVSDYGDDDRDNDESAYDEQKVATDARLAQEDHTTDSPDRKEQAPSSEESALINGHLVADVPTPPESPSHPSQTVTPEQLPSPANADGVPFSGLEDSIWAKLDAKARDFRGGGGGGGRGGRAARRRGRKAQDLALNGGSRSEQTSSSATGEQNRNPGSSGKRGHSGSEADRGGRQTSRQARGPKSSFRKKRENR